MKKRLKEALNLKGVKLTEVAEEIGMKRDTLRKALDRDSLNDGYLILIEKSFGISKKWLKEGIKPIIIDRADDLISKIKEDSFDVLENIDPEKIVAYLLLKENKFKKIPAFMSLVEKLKATKRLEDIANGDQKSSF